MKNSLDAPEYEPYEPDEFALIDEHDESVEHVEHVENDEAIEVVSAQRVWPLEIPQEWRDRLVIWQARVAEEMRSLHSRALFPQRWESEAATQPNLPVLRSLTPPRPMGGRNCCWSARSLSSRRCLSHYCCLGWAS